MTSTTHLSGVTETARRKPSGRDGALRGWLDGMLDDSMLDDSREGAGPVGSTEASYPTPIHENLRDRGVFAVDFARCQLAGGT